MEIERRHGKFYTTDSLPLCLCVCHIVAEAEVCPTVTIDSTIKVALYARKSSDENDMLGNAG